jgi:bilirubin oxidase
MPVPPVQTPLFTFTSPATGPPINYYEIEIKPLFRQQHPELPLTRMVGYDAIAPGQYIELT